jgi:GT2 family glycosyltransferase
LRVTDQCQEWIGHCAENFPVSGPVLEVGSFDVNGNPRHHFSDRKRFPEYTGIDMREGPQVDAVMNVQNLGFEDNRFGVIVDAERLEHDARFWLSIKEEFRVCKPGGHIIITTRSWGGFGPHDFPSDYWRFMDNGLRDLLEYAGFQCLATAYGERWAAGDAAVFAIGTKPDLDSKSNFSVVILSANPENVVACIHAIVENEPDLPRERIIVVDDGAFPLSKPFVGIRWITGKKPFIFARNANLGIKAANSDVILLNDDARLMTKHGFTELAKRKRGIVSAAISGMVGNKNQIGKNGGLRPEPKMLCFICVLIPQAVQEKLGPLDERFTGYGFDDDDYSKRALDAGIPLFVYDGCVVEHGTLKPTFRSRKNWAQDMEHNQKLYAEKWA